MESLLALPKRRPQIVNEKAPKRKGRSERLVLDMIFLQMAEQGIVMKCGCGCGRILTRDNLRGEHETARELTVPGVNPDRPENQRYWCKDPCSLKKDKRDIAAIAKGKRIRGETKQGPKAKIKSRGFQKPADPAIKAKIGNRGWPKKKGSENGEHEGQSFRLNQKR